MIQNIAVVIDVEGTHDEVGEGNVLLCHEREHGDGESCRVVCGLVVDGETRDFRVDGRRAQSRQPMRDCR